MEWKQGIRLGTDQSLREAVRPPSLPRSPSTDTIFIAAVSNSGLSTRSVLPSLRSCALSLTPCGQTTTSLWRSEDAIGSQATLDMPTLK